MVAVFMVQVGAPEWLHSVLWIATVTPLVIVAWPWARRQLRRIGR